jgi:hypothetical protein
MESNLQTPNFQYLDLVNYCVAQQDAEKTDYEIKQVLLAKGYDETMITKAIEASKDVYAEQINKKANRNIIIGSVLLVIGLLITLGTYSSGGGRYVITYGAILGGIAQIIGGIVQKNKI